MASLRLVRDEVPKAPVAERAVLAGMLLAGDGQQMQWSMGDLMDRLTPEDFYDEQHGKIYEWLMLRYEAGLAYDFITACEQIHAHPNPEQFGGPSKINWIYGSEHSTIQTLHYAAIIAETAKKRRLLRLLSDSHNALRGGASIAEVQTKIESSVTSSDFSAGAAVESVSSLIGSVFNGVLAEAEGRRATFYRTGIPEFDDSYDTNGVSLKGVTLVIARSGIGKTTLANTLAVQMARCGRRVMVCPTETSKARRVKDLAFSMAGINQQTWSKICNLRRTDENFEFEPELRHMRSNFEQAAYDIANLPIHITQTGWTVERLCAEVRRHHREGNVDVVIIDYLQDLRPSKHVKGSRSEQVGHSSKMIKDLQTEIGIPIILFAQAKHTDNTPQPKSSNGWLIPAMGAVQWASQAYQDAEEVWSLYRQDAYAEYEDCELPGLPSHLTIAFRKRRDGQCCTINVPCNMAVKWIGLPWEMCGGM